MTISIFCRRYLVFFVIGIFSIVISSCLKEDDFTNYDSESSSFAGLAGFNVITNSRGLDLLVDGKVMNTDEFFDLGGNIAHKRVFPGNRTIKLFNRKLGQEVYSGSYEMSPGKVYSAFFFGDKQVKMKVTEDNMIAPADGKVKIRFANFTNDHRVNLKLLVGKSVTVVPKVLDLQGVTDFLEFNRSELLFQFDYGIELSSSSIKFVPKNKGVYTILLFPRSVQNSESLTIRDYDVKVIEHNNN